MADEDLFLKAMADEEEQLRDQGAEDEEWVGCDGCGKWRKVPARVPARPEEPPLFQQGGGLCSQWCFQ